MATYAREYVPDDLPKILQDTSLPLGWGELPVRFLQFQYFVNWKEIILSVPPEKIHLEHGRDRSAYIKLPPSLPLGVPVRCTYHVGTRKWWVEIVTRSFCLSVPSGVSAKTQVTKQRTCDTLGPQDAAQQISDWILHLSRTSAPAKIQFHYFEWISGVRCITMLAQDCSKGRDGLYQIDLSGWNLPPNTQISYTITWWEWGTETGVFTLTNPRIGGMGKNNGIDSHPL